MHHCITDTHIYSLKHDWLRICVQPLTLIDLSKALKAGELIFHHLSCWFLIWLSGCCAEWFRRCFINKCGIMFKDCSFLALSTHYWYTDNGMKLLYSYVFTLLLAEVKSKITGDWYRNFFFTNNKSYWKTVGQLNQSILKCRNNENSSTPQY